MVKIIDLHFQQQTGVIAAFLVETPVGPVLIETGPYSTFPALEEGLRQHGYRPADVQHVFITHIHLDHAGAAWAFAKHGATIYLHPLGVPHLHKPEKLLSSAKRIYQDEMDSLWGDMQPIPTRQLRAVKDKKKISIGKVAFRARHTPGHANHHVAWEVNDFAFTGDVAGVRIGENGPAMPPCPPPDINIETWLASLHYLRTRRYKALYLTHFGEVNSVKSHFTELEGRLLNWANWIKPYWEQGATVEEVIPLFKGYVDAQLIVEELNEADRKRYGLANPAEMSVAGLFRYWSKKNPTA